VNAHEDVVSRDFAADEGDVLLLGVIRLEKTKQSKAPRLSATTL
jgi:hypothetical protein